MPTLNGKDDVVESLIAARQWKEAFKLCEKKLKKAKGSDYLQAKKIFILLIWPDIARKKQGYEELDALLERNPPVADIETLLYLEEFSISEGQLGPLGTRWGQMWQRAAASRPQDEKLHMQWYQVKFDAGDLKASQQASMSWMKNFPKNRKPYFLYILTTHLVSESPNTPENEKKLMQMLAYKNMSKAIQLAFEDEKGGRDIHKPEDLFLLLRIYRAQGKYDDAMKVIDTAQQKKMAPILANNWEVARQMIELTVLAQQWGKLFSYCSDILVDSFRAPLEPSSAQAIRWGRLGDDWKVWQALLTANESINSELIAQATEELLTTLQEAKLKERNARLALLSFHATELLAGRKDHNDLLSACQNYFCDFSSRFACFQDLKRYVPFLTTPMQERLLMLTSDHAQHTRPGPESSDSEQILWITSEINALKLEYHLVVSKYKNKLRGDSLIAFISNCLRLYKVSLLFGLELPVTDRRPGDDAAMLAAMGLVRLYKLKDRNSAYNNALLRAILILEFMLLHSKYNYEALLILVRLYMFYGAGSLAMERYSRLSIKHMQHASLSWILYTRISTIHPYPSTIPTVDSKGVMTIDPLEDLFRALKWHQGTQDLNFKLIHTMQDQGQWNMILDTVKFEKDLSSSFSKSLLMAEAKRICRFRAPSQNAEKHPDIRIPPQTNDTRDRSAFPNFEGDLTAFEFILPKIGTSTEINDRWLTTQFLLTRLWDVLHSDGYSTIVETELANLRDRCGENRYGEDDDPCTDEERAVVNVVSALYELYRSYTKTVLPQMPDDVDVFIRDMLEKLDQWLPTHAIWLMENIEQGRIGSAPLAADLNIPHWGYFHAMYTYLELCKLMAATLRYAVAENRRQGKQAFIDQKWLETKVAKICHECERLASMVSRSANELRDRLQGLATLQDIDQAVVGRVDDTEDLIGMEVQKFEDCRPAMTKFCRDIQGSWIEGLDGVIQTSVV